jgi:hypothetical protein
MYRRFSRENSYEKFLSFPIILNLRQFKWDDLLYSLYDLALNADRLVLLSHYRNDMLTARPKFLALQMFSSSSLSVICCIYDLNLHVILMLLHGPAHFVLFVKCIVVSTLSSK